MSFRNCEEFASLLVLSHVSYPKRSGLVGKFKHQDPLTLSFSLLFGLHCLVASRNPSVSCLLIKNKWTPTSLETLRALKFVSKMRPIGTIGPKRNNYHGHHPNTKSLLITTPQIIGSPLKLASGLVSQSLEIKKLCHFFFYNVVENENKAHFVLECPSLKCSLHFIL